MPTGLQVDDKPRAPAANPAASSLASCRQPCSTRNNHPALSLAWRNKSIRRLRPSFPSPSPSFTHTHTYTTEGHTRPLLSTPTLPLFQHSSRQVLPLYAGPIPLAPPPKQHHQYHHHRPTAGAKLLAYVDRGRQSSAQVGATTHIFQKPISYPAKRQGKRGQKKRPPTARPLLPPRPNTETTASAFSHRRRRRRRRHHRRRSSSSSRRTGPFVLLARYLVHASHFPAQVTPCTTAQTASPRALTVIYPPTPCPSATYQHPTRLPDGQVSPKTLWSAQMGDRHCMAPRRQIRGTHQTPRLLETLNFFPPCPQQCSLQPFHQPRLAKKPKAAAAPSPVTRRRSDVPMVRACRSRRSGPRRGGRAMPA